MTPAESKEIREYLRATEDAAKEIRRMLRSKQETVQIDGGPLVTREAYLAELAVDLSGSAAEVQGLLETAGSGRLQ